MAATTLELEEFDISLSSIAAGGEGVGPSVALIPGQEVLGGNFRHHRLRDEPDRGASSEGGEDAISFWDYF